MVRMQIGTVILENSVKNPQIIKNISTLCPAVPFLSIFKGTEISILYSHLPSHVYCHIVHNNKDRETTSGISFIGRMDKEEWVKKK